jgi:hypothetical protein
LVHEPRHAQKLPFAARHGEFSVRWGDWGQNQDRMLRLLLSKCENVVDVSRHKHLEGTAMKYFAGLDVSLEETALCIVDESGRIVKESAGGERAAGAVRSVAGDGPAVGAYRAGSVFAGGVAS